MSALCVHKRGRDRGCVGHEAGAMQTSENAQKAKFAEFTLSVIGRKRCLEIAPLPLLLKIAVNSHSGGWTDKRGPVARLTALPAI
jgi:hypothetical protein